MDRAKLPMRMVALIAAYAVALSALLSPLSLLGAPGAALAGAPLCNGAVTDGSDGLPPVKHDLSCALACAAPDGAVVPTLQPAFVAANPVAVTAVIVALPHPPAVRGPQRARAPPLA